MKRPNKHETFLRIANELSKQSTCIRRQVGCVLIDAHYHIVGSGYNGVASKLEHCIDSECEGAFLPSGEGLHLCEAIHAEQNALMQCSNVNNIATCYTTTSPCIHCIKMLMNTSCKLIVFLDVYDSKAIDLWMLNSSETGRNYVLYSVK